MRGGEGGKERPAVAKGASVGTIGKSWRRIVMH